MTRPTRLGRVVLLESGASLGSTPVVEPDPNPEDPVDYASQDEAGAVQVAIDVGTVALVQEATHHTNSPGGNATATFGATPEVGNMLFAALFVRGTTTAVIHTATNPGWTKDPETPSGSTAADGGRFYLWYKVAGASEPTSVRVDATDAMDLWIGEFSGLDGNLDVSDHLGAIAATTNMTSGSITPTSGAGLLLAAFVQASRNASLALDATYTEQMDVDVDASGPSGVFGNKIVDPFSGSYSTSATSDKNEGYGWYLGAYSAAGGGVIWLPAPGANDGDDTTSEFSDATTGPCLRVALEVERLIYRIELDVGQASAGSTVYEFYGSDDAAFTAPVLLATLTFTATGSYTLDSAADSWDAATTYQYYQLEHVSGGGADREFYEIRLYSAVGQMGVTDHPELTGRSDPDQHPADAVTYTNTATGLAATDVQDAIDEVVLLGTISPTQLSANTDNWNPTGLSTADVIRASTDATRNLTGIVAPSISRRVVLENIGSNNLVLVHDATSTAANRFLCPGSGNLTLTPNCAVDLVYDETSDRWRVIEGPDTASGSGGYPATSSPSLSSNGDGAWDTDDYRLLINDSQRNRVIGSLGWVPYVTMTGFAATDGTGAGGLGIAANGGTLLVPMELKGHMLLQSVAIRQTSTSLARTWGWDLYFQDLNNGNSGENTLRRVAASNGDDSFTPGAASIRTLDAGSAPVYLGPGTYWLAIQCRHATNSLGLTFAAGGSGMVNTGQTKTTTNPNGATLDAVAATWTKVNDVYFVVMKGRVFGQTTAF